MKYTLSNELLKNINFGSQARMGEVPKAPQHGLHVKLYEKWAIRGSKSNKLFILGNDEDIVVDYVILKWHLEKIWHCTSNHLLLRYY